MFTMMNGVKVDDSHIGTRHNRLTECGARFYGTSKIICVVCACDCGAMTTVRISAISSGHTKSCGCLIVEAIGNRRRTHGCSGKATSDGSRGTTPEYRTWMKMRRRCNSPKDRRYHDYGGRGITVCERWNSFEAFLADMGVKPTDKHTIDRIDNNAGYSPENCRWATNEEQAANKRNTRNLTVGGITRTVSEWSRESGLSADCIMYRMQKGDTDILRPIDRICIDGCTRTATEWSKISGVRASTISLRRHRGWDNRDAVYRPIRPLKTNTTVAHGPTKCQ